MPPRIHPPSKAISSILRRRALPHHHHYATAQAQTQAQAYAPSPSPSHPRLNRTSPPSAAPIARYPTNQPPSFKPPEFRKSQLLRSYASLLRSTPLMLLFQHNNLKSSEWVGLRRELASALRKIDDANVATGRPSEHLADGIKLQIIQTSIFSTALKIVEFYKPGEAEAVRLDPRNPATNSAADMPVYSSHGEELTHTLSRAAHEAIKSVKTKHELDPLLSGPLVLLTFPTVSPQYLKAALSILSPSQPNFPAPMRRANPGWHDPAVQGGVQKLLLMGARVEGKVFDVEGTKGVGAIEGGLDGLRGQLVAMLQSIGGGLTSTLEGAGKSLYFTMEGRRGMLEDEEKGTSGEPADEETTAE